MMGKKSREKVKGEGYIAKAKEAILEYDDRKTDYAAYRVRRIYFKTRWAKELGIDNNPDTLADPLVMEKVMANPQISLEWRLCDRRVQKDLKNPVKRKEFIQSLTPEEKEIYLYGPDGQGGYVDLEDQKMRQVRKKAGKVVRKMVKRKSEDQGAEEYLTANDDEDADDDGEEDEDCLIPTLFAEDPSKPV